TAARADREIVAQAIVDTARQIDRVVRFRADGISADANRAVGEDAEAIGVTDAGTAQYAVDDAADNRFRDRIHRVAGETLVADLHGEGREVDAVRAAAERGQPAQHALVFERREIERGIGGFDQR